MSTFILAVCGNVDYIYTFPLSPPSRAAWIEMAVVTIVPLPCASRRLHGRRGLKLDTGFAVGVCAGRRLHGRRGLKYRFAFHKACRDIVAAFTGGVD